MLPVATAHLTVGAPLKPLYYSRENQEPRPPLHHNYRRTKHMHRPVWGCSTTNLQPRVMVSLVCIYNYSRGSINIEPLILKN